MTVDDSEDLTISCKPDLINEKIVITISECENDLVIIMDIKESISFRLDLQDAITRVQGSKFDTTSRCF